MTHRRLTDLSFEKILMNGISDMVFVMNVLDHSVFTYEFLNQAAMNNMNLTKDILGQKIHDVFPDERGDYLTNYYQQVLDTEKPVIYEDSYKSTSKETHYSKTELIPLFDENNKCTQIVGTIKNITHKKLDDMKKDKAWEDITDSHKRYQSLYNNNSDAIFTIDLDGQVIHGNMAVETLTGYAPLEFKGTSIYSLLISSKIDHVKKSFSQATDGKTKLCQTAIIHKNGMEIGVSLKITPLIIDKNIIGIYFILRDMTEFLISKRKLRENEEHFRIITENTNDLITLLDNKGDILYASPSYERILGINADKFVGKPFSNNIIPYFRHRLNRTIEESIKNGSEFKFQFKQYDQQEKQIWCEANGTPIFDNNNKTKRMVVLTRNIHLNKVFEEKLTFYAHHDSLTALPNRTLFNSKFEKTLESAQKNQGNIALLMLDIDHFKVINDTMGHDTGDQVIKEFGRRVNKVIRSKDMVARLGGDEFVVLLPRIELKDTPINLAKSILELIHKPWIINGYTFDVTTSIGIAMAPANMASQHSLMIDADLALYEAKKTGKNIYKIKFTS